MNWDDYELYDPGAWGPEEELPRAEARRAYVKLMTEKPARIEMLRRLLAASDVALRGSDEGIQHLNDWFVANIEADPDRPGWLLPVWYSVISDVRLFLGDVIIERSPGLRWEFFTWGKKSVSYQHAVIMGFSEWPDAKIDRDLDREIAAYGHRIIASRGSVGTEGTVVARGVEIDLDAHMASDLAKGIAIEPDMFLQRVRWAEAHA